MMFVDSHCHLNFEEFTGDLPRVLRDAREQGVKALLNIACRLEEIPSVLQLTDTQPDLQLTDTQTEIYASVGIHPHEAASTFETLKPLSIDEALKPYTSHPRLVGIGETGFDFYYNHSPRHEQEQAFRQQVELAVETNLPIIVHTRDAEPETIALLKSYAGQVKGVIHCFSGTQWLADEALALGFYLSFSGILTFPKAENLRDIAKTIPLERLLIETDAPFLAPVPKRGKRNEPAFMVHTANMLAQLKEVALETLAHQTTTNFYTLFSKAKC
jgi:TatD DNase family protein